MTPAGWMAVVLLGALAVVCVLVTVDQLRQARTGVGLDILDDRDLDTWTDDIHAARPDGCECPWPPRGPDHAMVTSADCPEHPPIREKR